MQMTFLIDNISTFEDKPFVFQTFPYDSVVGLLRGENIDSHRQKLIESQLYILTYIVRVQHFYGGDLHLKGTIHWEISRWSN